MNCDIDGVIIRSISRFDDDRGWLAELFRNDEITDEQRPMMSYVSMTRPGVVRGPHEHRAQTDLFCFLGPSNFRLYLWDNRPDSPGLGRHATLEAGEKEPLMILVPPGVVHAYVNIGDVDGLVFNSPNQLFRGPGRTEEVDEIRYESDPDSPFKID